MIHSTEATVLGGDGRDPSVSEIDRTVEQLEDEITTLCAHIGAAEHRLPPPEIGDAMGRGELS